jgi:kumamolisin
MVDFPASDSGVVAVGGTQVILDKNGKVVKETAWNDGPHSSTGGGRSTVEPRPKYQKDVDMPPNVTGNTFDGKGVPDVAENASPASGYVVRVGGKYGAIGGTSGAAPAMGAYTTAMSEAVGGRNFGNMNNFFYANGASGIFNDITQGDNNGYKSGKGWDAVTGWGTPKIPEMIELLKSDKTGNPAGRHPRFVPSTAPTTTSIPGG